MTYVNQIDRAYLIPQEDGGYFPMSVFGSIRLAEPLPAESLRTALLCLIDSVYAIDQVLDLDTWRWYAAADREAYVDTILTLDEAADDPNWVGEQVQSNAPLLPRPLQITLGREWLHIKMHHSFGDGRFLSSLMSALLAETHAPGVCDLPPAAQTAKVWRVVWSSPGMAWRTFSGMVRSMGEMMGDYQRDTKAMVSEDREPIRDGSPMAVRHVCLPPEVMARWKQARGKVTLNTYLQAHLGLVLHQLDYVEAPITYTIPVDLRRYLPEDTPLRRGNLSSQIRVTRPETEMDALCAALQREIDHKLETAAPLHGLPGEWLFNLAGKRAYERINRDWLLKSTYNDPRFFVLSNVGRIDSLFNPAQVREIYFTTPLMGAPPLVINFTSYRGQAQMTFTYDPVILADDAIDRILEAVICAG